MKQLIGSIALVVLALQGLACSGADGASDSAETASPETGISAADAVPHESSADVEAPTGVQLLSPAERDAQLAALSVTAPGEPELEAPVGALALEDVLRHALELTAGRELSGKVETVREGR